MNKTLVKLNSTFKLIMAAMLFLCGCSKQTSKNELNYNELKEHAYAELDKKQNEQAAEYLEEMLMRFSDQQDISQHKMSLAEIYFKLGKFPSAYELYSNFAQFYPSDEKAEYARYQAILSKFYQTLKLDCDQTTTMETTRLCKEYLENPSFKQYTTDVRDIQNTCELKLIDKEIYVFNYYLKQGKYKAAENRIKALEKDFLPKNPKIEDRILYLKCQLARTQKKNQEFKETFDLLSTKYPHSQFTQLAQGRKKKTSDFFF